MKEKQRLVKLINSVNDYLIDHALQVFKKNGGWKQVSDGQNPECVLISGETPIAVVEIVESYLSQSPNTKIVVASQIPGTLRFMIKNPGENNNLLIIDSEGSQMIDSLAALDDFLQGSP